MDFRLDQKTIEIQQRTREFVEREILPLEAERANFDSHENINQDVLASVRAKVQAAGLWAPQIPVSLGGMGLSIAARANMYEGGTQGRQMDY